MKFYEIKISKKIKLIILGIVLYLTYVFYHCNNIKFINLIKYIVKLMDFFLNALSQFILNCIESIKNPEVIKVFIIIIFLAYILRDTSIVEIIKSIKNIEIKGVKVEMKEMKKTKEEEELKVENLKEQPETDDKEKKIKLAQKRIELMELIIDNPIIAKLIYICMKSSTKNVSIPMNIVLESIPMEKLSSVFECELKNNSIKLIGFKKDLEPMIIDVFNELLKKNIIYPEY